MTNLVEGLKQVQEALEPKRIVIAYPYDFMNEQSEAMEGQVQTTKAARDIFEQYRKGGFRPLWESTSRENSVKTYFTGISILSYPHDAAALLPSLIEQAKGMEWQPIETAPHEVLLLVGWYDKTFEQWECEVAMASYGKRNSAGYSNRSYHGQATHWMPLPQPPKED